MIERLGQVLYWAACIVAAIAAFLSYWAGTHATDPGAPFTVILLAGFAVIVWLMGRALLYLFSGR